MTKLHSKDFGCFLGIAWLLLCKHSLQMHPSDKVTERTSFPVECDHVSKDEQQEYHRVRVSLSFREAPTLSNSEDKAEKTG